MTHEIRIAPCRLEAIILDSFNVEPHTSLWARAKAGRDYPAPTGASGRQLRTLDDLQSCQVRETQTLKLTDDQADAFTDQPPCRSIGANRHLVRLAELLRLRKKLFVLVIVHGCFLLFIQELAQIMGSPYCSYISDKRHCRCVVPRNQVSRRSGDQVGGGGRSLGALP